MIAVVHGSLSGMFIPSINGDGDSALLAHHRAKEGVALDAGGLLEPATVAPRASADIGDTRPQRDAEAPAEIDAESRVLAGARPKGMVEVACDHTKTAFGPGFRQRVRQGHGIRAAREADDQRLAGGRRPESQQGPAHGGRQSGSSHLQSLPPEGKWWRCRDSNPGRRGYEPRALTS